MASKDAKEKVLMIRRLSYGPLHLCFTGHLRAPNRALLCGCGDSPIKNKIGIPPLLASGSEKRVLWKRDLSREFRDSRDSREPPDCGKQRRMRPFSRDSREFSGDSPIKIKSAFPPPPKKPKFQGKIIYTSPLPPISGRKAFLGGGGRGCIF